MLTLKRLTLSVPRALEETVTETLLAMQPEVPGFSALEGSGHGEGFDHAGVEERVRGAIARCLILLVLPGEDVVRVLDQLRRALPHPDIVWWVEPVEAMGRLDR